MIAWLRRRRAALVAFIFAGAVMDVWFVHVVGTPNVGLTAAGLELAVAGALLAFLVMSRRSSSPKDAPSGALRRTRGETRP